MPETTTRKPRTVERRIAHLAVLYKSLELAPDGNWVEFQRSARRGELVVLSVGEAARLDSFGALGPVGCTKEQIDADIEALYSLYQDARRGVPAGL